MRGQSRDYRLEAIFNREGPGEKAQLHVLIPKVPCQTFTCSQASPDFRLVQMFQMITFCFLFVFSLFSPCFLKIRERLGQGTIAKCAMLMIARYLCWARLVLGNPLSGMRTCKLHNEPVQASVFKKRGGLYSELNIHHGWLP